MSASDEQTRTAHSQGTVLLATLNENDSIRPVLEEVVESIRSLERFGHQISILVVDDSPDLALQGIVSRCGSEWNVVVNYIRGPQRGLGAALSHGLDYAIGTLNCDYVINLDADGQHDARQIPDLLRAHLTSHSAITIGSRWTRGGKCYGLSMPRKMVSRMSSFVLRLTSIPWHVKDPTTSFRIYSRECVVRCSRETLGFSGFSFFGCIVAVADAQSLPIIEVPIHFRPRFAGKSNLRLRQMWRAVRDLPRIRATAKMVERRRQGGVGGTQTDAYPANDLLDHLSTTERTAQRWIERFQRFLGSNVLEVGSGIGQNTDILARSVATIVSLEPDEALCTRTRERCSQRTNVSVHHSTLRQFSASSKRNADFDSVVYVNVLEHIEDDLNELRMAHSLLSENGRIIVFSPARPSYYGTLDSASMHHRRYTKREAQALLLSAGFEVSLVEEHDPLGGLVYFLLYRLLRIRSAGRGSVFAYDNIVLPVSQLVARFCRYRLPGKNLLFVGHKR